MASQYDKWEPTEDDFSVEYDSEPALETISDTKNTTWIPVAAVGLYHNLSGFSDFLNSMASLNLYSLYGSREMLLDAIYLAVHNVTSNLTYPISDLEWSDYSVKESIPELANFKVNWRSNTDKIIILFTDENEQSYMVPQLVVDDIIAAVSGTPKLKVYIFSNYESWSWDEIAVAGNGKYYDLTSNPTQMYNSLMEILDDICILGGNNAEE